MALIDLKGTMTSVLDSLEGKVSADAQAIVRTILTAAQAIMDHAEQLAQADLEQAEQRGTALAQMLLVQVMDRLDAMEKSLLEYADTRTIHFALSLEPKPVPKA